jgi:hypothetical protein
MSRFSSDSSASASLSALPEAWRRRAEFARELAAEGAARAFEACALDLESALNAQNMDLLTLTQAARVSGFSADHLGRLVREGKITNFGRQNAPRVRAADLPRKAKASTCLTDSPAGVTSFSQVARAVLNRHSGGGDD